MGRMMTVNKFPLISSLTYIAYHMACAIILVTNAKSRKVAVGPFVSSVNKT